MYFSPKVSQERLENMRASSKMKAAMQDFKEHEKSKKHDTTEEHNNIPKMYPQIMKVYDFFLIKNSKQ